MTSNITKGFVALLTLVAVMTFLPGKASAKKVTFENGMDSIFVEYQKITKALAGDETKGIKKAAGIISGIADNIDISTIPEKHRKHLEKAPENIRKASVKMAVKKSGAPEIEGIREALADLSKPMAMWAGMLKPDISVMYCSMKPGSWLQADAGVKNPYYGKSMLTCGDLVSGPEKPEKGKGHGDMHGKMKSKMHDHAGH